MTVDIARKNKTENDTAKMTNTIVMKHFYGKPDFFQRGNSYFVIIKSFGYYVTARPVQGFVKNQYILLTVPLQTQIIFPSSLLITFFLAYPSQIQVPAPYFFQECSLINLAYLKLSCHIQLPLYKISFDRR
jgi:hypothetical protein